MPLKDFQVMLGASIRHGTGLDAVVESAGFRFTVKVQRSWCRGRAAKGARLTLSILDVDLRQRLLDTWVASGGGTASVLTAEADAFLDFIAGHLPDPSHTLTICRLEQATLRASEGTATFAAVALPWRGGILRAARHAAIVHFHAEPDRLFEAINTAAPLPPVAAEPVVSILFAPGLDSLSRIATADEIGLWNRLPSTLAALLDAGHALDTMESLAAAGALDASPLAAALRA
jgi:hypothetical protein